MNYHERDTIIDEQNDRDMNRLFKAVFGCAGFTLLALSALSSSHAEDFLPNAIKIAPAIVVLSTGLFATAGRCISQR